MPNVVVVTKMILPQAPTPSCASTTSCRFPRRMSTIFHHLARSQNAQLDGPRTTTRIFSHSSFYRWLGLIIRLDEPTDIEIRRKKEPNGELQKYRESYTASPSLRLSSESVNYACIRITTNGICLSGVSEARLKWHRAH